jgi:hypothetical protein
VFQFIFDHPLKLTEKARCEIYFSPSLPLSAVLLARNDAKRARHRRTIFLSIVRLISAAAA